MSKRLLVRDQRGERERLLVGTMTVGRDPRCDISDADPLLSRHHAEFVCSQDTLVVRDLNSRNGIAVNGEKVKQAELRPGDVVKIARLAITYLADLDSVRPASPPPAVPSVQQVRPQKPDLRRSAAGPTPVVASENVRVAAAGRHGGAKTAKIKPAVDADDASDRTNLVPRRSEPRGGGLDQVVVARLTPPVLTPLVPPAPPRSAAPGRDDSDSTRPVVHRSEVQTVTPVVPSNVSRRDLVPLGEQVPSDGRAAPPPVVAAAPAPVGVPGFADSPLEDWSVEINPPQAESAQPPQRVVVPPAGGRVMIATVGLAAVVFTLTAVSMATWQQWVVRSLAPQQALSTVSALAANAGAALQIRGPEGLGAAVNRTNAVDGVVAALIIWPDGRVAAPASSIGQRVTRIPGRNLDVGAIQLTQCTWNGGVLEAVAPVSSADGGRAAVAWVTYRPGGSAGPGSAVVALGPALFFSVAAGWAVGRWLRRTQLAA
jgi:hypothetical protein